MAQFDIQVVDDVYFLHVQSNFLDSLRSRLAVPLMPIAEPMIAMRRLNPQFDVDGQRLMMATHLMVAVPTLSLGRPIGSLDWHYDEIRAAIDFIFNGF